MERERERARERARERERERALAQGEPGRASDSPTLEELSSSRQARNAKRHAKSADQHRPLDV